MLPLRGATTQVIKIATTPRDMTIFHNLIVIRLQRAASGTVSSSFLDLAKNSQYRGGRYY